MSLGSTSARTIPWAGQAHRYNVNAPGQQPQIAISGFLPTPILVPRVPLVDTNGWLPPTPRIPLRELPPLPLLPEPLFRLHPIITSVVTFSWDVRLHLLPTEFSSGALALPAFDSSPSIKSFTLRFSPLPGTPTMDYSCEVKMPARAPRDSPITIGRVFRCIHRAIYAPLEPTALPQGDPVRSHVERAYRRRTAGRVDVLRNVDLHMAGQADNDGDGDGGLFFHGIVVEEVMGPCGAYPVFRVVLKDYPPFA